MNPNNPFMKGPLVWILAAGIVIGAGATATVLKTKGGSNSSYQAPLVSLSSPKPVGQVHTESLDMVKALDESFANLADAAKPAVVHIRVQNSGARNQLGELQAIGGEGSGFIFRPDGYIITNDHVAGGFEKVTVILYDGREFPGKVLRVEDSDIAVVKIDAKDLPTLPFADSNQVRAGEFAIAVGAPYGLENTVTVGHISATQRSHQIPDPNLRKVRNYTDLIQTDAAINVGNSGGPLLNIEGQVVGINSAILSPSGTSGGIGFAISSNQARLLAETVIEKGKVERGFLGIAPENLKSFQARQLGVEKGALVADLPSDGPAAIAGIKKGDVVVRINSIPVDSQVDLRNAMIKYGPGSKVEVEVIRDKQSKTFSVTAKTPPVNPQMTTPKESKVDIDDFPGFKDFPRGVNPDELPNRPSNPRLGVEVGNADETNRKTHNIPAGVSGAVINSVAPRSMADSLAMQVGDVIIEIDGKKIGSAAELASAMRSVKWGDSKSIKFLRFSKDGSRQQYERNMTFR
jgi:serine protease Do